MPLLGVIIGWLVAGWLGASVGFVAGCVFRAGQGVAMNPNPFDFEEGISSSQLSGNGLLWGLLFSSNQVQWTKSKSP